MPEKKTVFVDTCAIIDAVRLGCWADLCRDYAIQTVEEVRDETQRGDKSDPEYVVVDPGCFGTTVAVHAVSNTMRTRAATRLRSIPVDRGEFDLLAFVLTQDPNALILSSTDAAAVTAGCQLGLSSRFRSLEQLVARGRATPIKFPEKCTEKWLGDIKTKFESQRGARGI